MGKQVESALNELIEDVDRENPIPQENAVEVEDGGIVASYPKTQAETLELSGIPATIEGFTPEQRKQLAESYTAQIRMGIFQTAIALVAMKQTGLYTELGYKNFQEYALEECGISANRAKELVSALEDFGSGSRIRELMEASPKKFLQAVRETRNKQLEGETLMLSDGTEVSAEEYLAERIEQMESSSRRKIKDLERDLRNANAVKEMAETKNKDLESKLDTAKKKIDAYKDSKNLDPDRILKIKEQREAEKIILERVTNIDQALKDLIEIPHEIRNNSLGLYIARTIATLDVTLRQVRMDWGGWIIAGEQEANG